MIKVDRLTHRFGKTTVLRDISLEVAEGEVVALMGSSGGGKTTLLRCISGLLTPSEGTVTVEGVDVRTQPEKARKLMGMVFQSAALFDYMTLEENLMFGLQRLTDHPTKDQKKIAEEALLRVGLAKSDLGKNPSELSGGMRKRAGIARAIALKPRVMLYDEPTTGLDPITTYTIDQLIHELRTELKMASLVVSHDVTSVSRVADRIGFLSGGELVFLGTVPEFEKSNLPQIRELVDKAAATEFVDAK